MELVFEAEGSLALDSTQQPAPGMFADGFGEVGHVWYQTHDGSGSMQTRSSSSMLTGVWLLMPVSAVQNTISPVCGSISHRRS